MTAAPADSAADRQISNSSQANDQNGQSLPPYDESADSAPPAADLPPPDSKPKRRKTRKLTFHHGKPAIVVEGPDGEELEQEHETGRKVFFGIPLPKDLTDEDGKPLQNFARNKIRTAKYTPLSFIPKNLWFQFHNLANIFFLFVVILVVSACPTLISLPQWQDQLGVSSSSSPYSVAITQA